MGEISQLIELQYSCNNKCTKDNIYCCCWLMLHQRRYFLLLGFCWLTYLDWLTMLHQRQYLLLLLLVDVPGLGVDVAPKTIFPVVVGWYTWTGCWCYTKVNIYCCCWLVYLDWLLMLHLERETVPWAARSRWVTPGPDSEILSNPLLMISSYTQYTQFMIIK